MYEIYEIHDQKIPSYYVVQDIHNRSSNQRLNTQFKIYDNLENNCFDNISRGNKSIIYDNIQIILEEFQLSNLTDEQLWDITVIAGEVLKEKYNNYTNTVLNATFKEIEEYLEREGIDYGRLGKYRKPSSGQFEGSSFYFG